MEISAVMDGLEEQFYLIESISRGEFSRVELAWRRDSSHACALKIFEKEGEQNGKRKRKLTMSVDDTIAQRLTHPNLITVYDVLERPTLICVVMEHVKGANLRETLDFLGGIMSESRTRHFFVQLVSGLEYLHANGLPHGDLRPENAMIDTRGRLKLVGFWCRERRASSGGFEPPEARAGTRCRSDPYQMDMWSAGALLYVLVTGQEVRETEEQRFTIAEWESSVFERVRSSDELKLLMRSLMSPRPTERPTCRELHAHPWMMKRSTSGAEDEEKEMKGDPGEDSDGSYDPDEDPRAQEFDDLCRFRYESDPNFERLLECSDADGAEPSLVLGRRDRRRTNVYLHHDWESKRVMFRMTCRESRSCAAAFVQMIMDEQGHDYEKVNDYGMVAHHLCERNFTEFRWRFECHKVIALPTILLNFFFISGSLSSFKEKISLMKESIRNNLDVVPERRGVTLTLPRPSLASTTAGDETTDDLCKESFYDVEDLKKALN